MGNLIKKVIHIEFYGLPGSGKSSVSHLVAKQLRSMGMVVKEPSYESDHGHSLFGRVLLKLSKTAYYMYHNFNDFNLVVKLVKKNGYTSIFSSISQLVNIIPKIGVYKSMSNNYDICIWDEGLIQSSISLSLNSGILPSKNYYELKKISGHSTDVIKVYIDVELVEVLKRIENRKDGRSRVDQEKDTRSRRIILTKFLACCRDFKNNSAIINNSNLQNTANLVIDKILKYKII